MSFRFLQSSSPRSSAKSTSLKSNFNAQFLTSHIVDGVIKENKTDPLRNVKIDVKNISNITEISHNFIFIRVFTD